MSSSLLASIIANRQTTASGPLHANAHSRLYFALYITADKMIGSFLLQINMVILLIALIKRLSRARGPNHTRDESTAERGLSPDPTNLETEIYEKAGSFPSKDQAITPQAPEQPRPTSGTDSQPVGTQPEQETMSSSTPSPPQATPSPIPKPTTRKAGPYKAVRVLFLSWENERHLTTPCNALMNKLRKILGLTYHFTIQEFFLPASGPESPQPDAALLKYLLQKDLLLTSLPNTSSKASEFNELLIVIYSGSGAIINGRYHLVTQVEARHRREDDPTLPPGWRKMPWEWFERRLASARYDSLCVLNASYVPTRPVTAQEVRGANMVLAAAGPETGFCTQVLSQNETERQDKGGNNEHLGYVVPWSSGFLEEIIGMFIIRMFETNAHGKVSVDQLFKRLVLEHDRSHVRPNGGKEEEISRPYLGYIKGKEGEHEDRVIEIGLDSWAGRGKKRMAPSEGGDMEWTFC
ncbi:hypothetical protein QBC37DRAFT_454262 [Rhypophila decipiens]|uniref:Uncharacterized protein n=1 Tax=Rhypophila decipiens TaxID=261697 RepID=A0AAN7B2V4_9PEZI|nr:hypothetical protein QBC37DRAFT_454262 [Rhypophila decipiens]